MSPRPLDDCVKDLYKKGIKNKSRAYAICSKRTGYTRKKGGVWKKKGTTKKN